jgi:hypothetical protein
LITPTGSGTYMLRIDSAPTTHFDQKLFAIPQDDYRHSPIAWKITPVPQGDEKNAYM